MGLLRRNKQLVCDAGRGDCFRACVTSLLGLPNDPSLLPGADDPEMHLKFLRFLRGFGLEASWSESSCWGSGYWIAAVKSKNFSGRTHAIIMNGSEVEFDPSGLEEYEAGKRPDEGVVVGGWTIEVIDAGKLRELVELQGA